MAKIATDDLLDAFKEMTLIELSEFVKQFEETFGVTAAAPVAVAAAPTTATGAAAVTSKTSSNCFTNSDSSISVISLNASSSSTVLSFAMSGNLS